MSVVPLPPGAATLISMDRLLAPLLSPLLIAQALRLRARALRLPEPPGPRNMRHYAFFICPESFPVLCFTRV